MFDQGVDDLYRLARDTYQETDWAGAIQAASKVLVVDPLHAAAFELLVTARRHLDLASSPVGEQRMLSVLMCDLVGSSRLPQAIGSEPYRNMLLQIQQVCANAVTAYEGRIAQYLGDGVLAYFSYPQAHEDDALRAVLAGLTIVREVEQLTASSERLYGVAPRVRVGIDSGLVIVGAMGAGRWTTADSIVGDAPNMASRLQHRARPNAVVISDATYRLVTNAVQVRSGRPTHIKGFVDPIRSHRVLAASVSLPEFERAARRTPLVGRDDELHQLAELWAAVMRGERRTVQLVGEAGVGKSRVADQLVNMVNASGGRQVTLRCSALHHHVAFHPATEGVRTLLALDALKAQLGVDTVESRLRTMAGDRPELHDTAITLARLLGADVELDLQPDEWRGRTFAAFSYLVSLIAATTPLLLLVEDLHDADPSTVELIERLRADVQGPMIILVTMRPHGSTLSGDVHEMHLASLPHQATEAIVRAVLADADDEVVTRVVERCDGVPLFAEELARWVDEVPSSTALPSSLEALLLARLDQLEPHAREVASAAAVFGASVRHEDLAEVSEAAAGVLQRSIELLIDRQLLTIDADSRERVYRFSHVLQREAAYRRQVPSVRASRHLRCASVFERRRREGRTVPAPVVATHFEEAGRRRQALDWWQLAALDAGASGAHVEATNHFRQALTHIDVVADDSERAEVEARLRLGLGASGSMVVGYTAPEVLEAFERAEELSRDLPASRALVSAYCGQYTNFLVAGQLERAETRIRRALDMAGSLGDAAAAGACHAALAYVLFFRGELAAAVVHLDQTAEARLIPGVPQDPRMASAVLRGIIEWCTGDVAASRATIARALDDSDRLDGDSAAFTQAFVLNYVAWLAQLAGDPDAASSRALAAIDVANRHQFLQWLGAASLHLAAAQCATGQLDAGEPVLEVGLDAWRMAGAELLRPYFLSRLAMAKLERNDAAAAVSMLDEALDCVRSTGERVYECELLRIRARALRAGDAPATAVRADLLQAVSLAEATGCKVFQLRALLDLCTMTTAAAAGDADDADDADDASDANRERLRELAASWPHDVVLRELDDARTYLGQDSLTSAQ